MYQMKSITNQGLLVLWLHRLRYLAHPEDRAGRAADKAQAPPPLPTNDPGGDTFAHRAERLHAQALLLLPTPVLRQLGAGRALNGM